MRCGKQKSVLIVKDETLSVYIRANKRVRVVGKGIRLYATDSNNGDRTYTRPSPIQSHQRSGARNVLCRGQSCYFKAEPNKIPLVNAVSGRVY